MAISFVNAGASSESNNPTLGQPASIAAADLLLIFNSTRGGGTVSTPTDYDEQAKHASSSGINNIALYKKIAVGDETTIGLTTSGGDGPALSQTCAIRGVDTVTPFVEATTPSENASAEDIGPISGLTIAAGNAVLVLAHRADNASTNTPGTSVGALSGDGLTWTQIGQHSSGIGADGCMGWYLGINNTGSPVVVTSKTVDVTGGSQAGYGMMLELQAAGGGGTPVAPRAMAHYRRRWAA
jgi:hypothetical protein